MRLVMSAAVCAIALTAARPLAQNPTPSGPTFEAASVKQNTSAAPNMSMSMPPGGRFNARNASLRMLIRFAYQIQDFQLVGGPDWMPSDRFDIVAKAEGDIPSGPPGTVGPIQLMLRALLADRFKLAVHRENRELPIYALVLARSDGRLGPQIEISTVDCEAVMRATPGGPPAAPSNAANTRPMCGMQMGQGTMTAGAFPISQLPASLSGLVQRTVVDKTGLTGNYNLTMTYTAERLGATPAIDSGDPSIFTALQEQLGLKLESQRGPVEVLVVDSAQRPVED